MGSMLQDVEPQLIEFEYLGTDESSVTAYDWRSRAKQTDCSCDCGSWKAHWLSHARKPWPAQCSAAGCNEPATVAAQLSNPDVRGHRIAPLCQNCLAIDGKFDLDQGVSLPSIDEDEHCGQLAG